MPLFEVQNLTRRFGGLVAVNDVSLSVETGEIRGLIGPNGAGKTTLVSQLTGNMRPDTGTIHFAGRDITHLPMHARVRLGLARSFQITSVLRAFTALDNVALAVQAHAGPAVLHHQLPRRTRRRVPAVPEEERLHPSFRQRHSQG